MMAVQKRDEDNKKRLLDERRKELMEVHGHAEDPHHAKHDAPHLSKGAFDNIFNHITKTKIKIEQISKTD